MADSDKPEAVKPEVVEADSGQGAGRLVTKTDDSRLVAFLSSASNAAPVDPQTAALDIVRRILAAEDAADVLKQTSAIHAQDVLGQDLQIVGFDYNESDIAGSGTDFYMLINCVDGNGEPFKVTCGAINVMAQLYRLGELAAFPLVARIVETEKATRNGYKPMWLEAVPPSF